MEGAREDGLVKAKACVRAPGSQAGSCINACERERDRDRKQERLRETETEQEGRERM